MFEEYFIKNGADFDQQNIVYFNEGGLGDRIFDGEIEVVAEGFQFTEGPVWDPETNALYFSDLPEGLIYKWTEKDGSKVLVR